MVFALKKILFISGSVGLGHVGRDLEIARSIRKMSADVEISWLAKPPASKVILDSGERLLSEANLLVQETDELQRFSEGYDSNLTKYVINVKKPWQKNAIALKQILDKNNYDLVIGDETYDILIERVTNKNYHPFPFIIIYDIFGVDCVTNNLIEKIATYYVNRLWVKGVLSNPPIVDASIFVGELDDIPDKKFGLLLPDRRNLARKNLSFAGYVFPFKPEDYSSKESVRKQLGYGSEKLIVCSVGGTAAGRELLNLCAKAFPMIKSALPNARMIVVCGPCIDPKSIQATEGLEILGYVPDLYKHFAAADICIVTGGGTTTLELTALQKPFLYFPLGKHFEQQVDVAYRCKRHNAGIRMDFNKTTPELLSNTILENMKKPLNYAEVSTNGAENAAATILKLLAERK
jgi:UDP-N-acetylglucosamine:LPS N-acetylglucosamine transferase